MYHSAMEPRPVSCSSFVPLLRRMSYLILKRGFDLVFSLVLLVTCALLMAVIALVVWLDSPGKIIYTQIRLGYGGKPFTIYKFRSMQQSTAPDDAKWTSENDTRITRVGHILRLTHLDELPQLLNIFMGEMSFVGPRPERPTVYDDLDGKIDYLVAGAGSGGTFTGVVKYLKEKDPNIKGVLADPVGSTMGGGEHGDYDIEGIGNDFIADTMDMSLVDKVVKITDDDAFRGARLLAKNQVIRTNALKNTCRLCRGK